MSDKVIVITPEIAPGAGGLADYTLRVIEQWEGKLQVEIITPKEGRPPGRPSESGGKVLLQYSAYGFDRHGYPRRLLRELVNWKRTSAGRLVVMLHEIWTFWPLWNKNYLVQTFHRHDLRRLIESADAVFTSTESQAGHLRSLAPGREIRVLPVGSNIRPIGPIGPIGPMGPIRDAGLAVLFGLPASRRRARAIMQSELAALLAAQKITQIIEAGGDTSPEEKISRLLARASFGISAQDELSITKSSAFMAYAAHGLNILSPFALPAAPEPLCWATHPAELLAGLSDAELQSRAAKLHAWQGRTCSWPGIAQEFAHALKV